MRHGSCASPLSTIAKVSEALDVPVKELFAGIGSKPGNDKEEILHLVKALVEQGDEGKLSRLRVFLEKVFR